MPHIELPEPDAGVLRRLPILIEGLRSRVGQDLLILDEDGRRAYETDAFTAYRRVPMLVEFDGNYYEPLSLAVLRTYLKLQTGTRAEVAPGFPEGYNKLEWLQVGPLSMRVISRT